MMKRKRSNPESTGTVSRMKITKSWNQDLRTDGSEPPTPRPRFVRFPCSCICWLPSTKLKKRKLSHPQKKKQEERQTLATASHNLNNSKPIRAARTETTYDHHDEVFVVPLGVSPPRFLQRSHQHCRILFAGSDDASSSKIMDGTVGVVEAPQATRRDDVARRGNGVHVRYVGAEDLWVSAAGLVESLASHCVLLQAQ